MTDSAKQPRTSPELAGVLRRLKKVLALTESAEPGEAAAALKQAKSIMDKYGLDAVDARASDVHRSESKLGGSDVPAWESRLISVVKDVLGVAVLIRRQEKAKGHTRKRATAIFIGEGSQAQIATYTFEVLRRQLVVSMKKAVESLEAELRLLPEAKKCAIELKITPKQRDAYATTWCMAVHQKIHGMVSEPSEAVVRYIEAMNVEPVNSTKKRSARPKDDPLGDYMLSKGLRDGRDAQLHRGMGTSSENTPLLGVKPQNS